MPELHVVVDCVFLWLKFIVGLTEKGRLDRWLLLKTSFFYFDNLKAAPSEIK